MKNENYGWMITGSTFNIGDDFQCIAARRFLDEAKICKYIDREFMNRYNDNKIKMILNGWYMHNPNNWPPSENIDPLLISMHISNIKQKNSGLVPAKNMLSIDNSEYLKKHGPVGCRDLFTYKLLQKKFIPCYFSGCLTLSLKSRRTKKDDYICLVDPSEQLENFIKSKTTRKIVVIRPEKNDWPTNYDERIKIAEKYLEIYANAHIVITSRLHGALPSLSMGTNVLLLENRFGDERYEGIKYFLNFATYSDLYSGKYPLNLDNPLPNPNEYLILRKNMELVVKAFTNGNLNDVDISRINSENLEALKLAKLRTIKFNKQNHLESIKIRQIKNSIRFKVRNLQNII